MGKRKKLTNTDKVNMVIDYLNETAGRRFKHGNTSSRCILARIKEGYTVDDCKNVIDRKCKEWLHDDYWSRFLNPQTLFRASKFEKYHNAAIGATSSIRDSNYSDILYLMSEPIIDQESISDNRRFDLVEMTYREYLDSPEWHHIRSKMRDVFKHCSICHSNKSLDVHHNNYPQRGSERMMDLSMLCRECHKKAHGARNRSDRTFFSKDAESKITGLASDRSNEPILRAVAKALQSVADELGARHSYVDDE